MSGRLRSSSGAALNGILPGWVCGCVVCGGRMEGGVSGCLSKHGKALLHPACNNRHQTMAEGAPHQSTRSRAEHSLPYT
jgi:hypothetical protein